MSEPRIGIDLGGTKIEGVLLVGDRPERRIRRSTPRDDYEGTLDAIAGLVDDLGRGLDAPPPVGLGTPGAISPATGRIKNANSVWLNDRPLHEDIERRLGRPVRMANDADCFAVSEAAAAGATSLFGVILGTGVGGGVVAGGRLVRGPNAIAGEWGHNPLPWPADDERPGAECYCGRRGCIETFLSGPGMERDHLAHDGEADTAEGIARRAVEGDPTAAGTVARYTDRLARSLATVINLLDPECIVLGGGLSNIDSLYSDVPRLWGEYVFSDRVATRLVPPVHGDSSGVLGAALLWEVT